jgi:hypothetical protein
MALPPWSKPGFPWLFDGIFGDAVADGFLRVPLMSRALGRHEDAL